MLVGVEAEAKSSVHHVKVRKEGKMRVREKLAVTLYLGGVGEVWGW